MVPKDDTVIVGLYENMLFKIQTTVASIEMYINIVNRIFHHHRLYDIKIYCQTR